MPSNFVFANFFETELLDDISAEVGLLHVTPAMAARLPVINEVMEARLVLWDGINMPEIVSVIDNQQTGYLSILRAREGTSSRPWSAGTQVICSLTAEIINSALQAYYDITAVLNLNFLKLTGGTLTGPLILSADPTLPLGAVTRQYADAVLGAKLPLIGGTMLGPVNMNGNRILNLPAAIVGSEPARKAEVDSGISASAVTINAAIAALDTSLNANIAGVNTALTASIGTVATNLNTATTNQGIVNSNNSGVLVTSGTSTNFIITPAGAVVAALVDGMCVSAKVHVTNDDAPTLQYSGTAAKPIRAMLGQTLPSRFLQAGLPFSFVYDSASDSWLLKGAYRPLFRNRPGDVKWSAIEVDHDDWLNCDGRSLLRTTYPGLFTNIGIKFGAVDGTHFNLPVQDGLSLVGRGNSLAVTQTLTTTAGNTTATVTSNAGLAIGNFVIPAAGNVAAGTKITDINGLTVTLSANALTSAANATRFSQLSDPNVTGAQGGVATRTQSRREVGQHLHANTVGETPHTHTINQLTGATVMSTAGGATNYAAGGFGAISAASGISLNNATAGVTITNVDSTAPVAMPMLHPSQVMNMFICAY